MREELTDISRKTIARYSARYQRLGYDVKTLGWGTTEQQIYRFRQTLDSSVDFNGRSIIDIGCGFGDYYDFLKSTGITLSSYTGWDVNPDLVNEAKIRHFSRKEANFQVQDMFKIPEKTEPFCDIGVSLGTLNFNLKEGFDNLNYSKLFIRKAFSIVREALIVDFLSSFRHELYPQEDFVYYHDPRVMMEFASTLSPDFILKHNYTPIPQKEFMLIIYKQSGKG